MATPSPTTTLPTYLLTTQPTPSPTTLPIPLPTTLPKKGLEEMCASVRNLTSVFTTSDTVTGTCTISQTCLTVNCSVSLQTEAGLTIPLALSITLLPCQSPFAISVKAKITFFGQTISIVDDTFSGNATIPVMISFISGTVNVTIIQQDCGILLSVSSHQTTMGPIILADT